MFQQDNMASMGYEGGMGMYGGGGRGGMYGRRPILEGEIDQERARDAEQANNPSYEYTTLRRMSDPFYNPQEDAAIRTANIGERARQDEHNYDAWKVGQEGNNALARVGLENEGSLARVGLQEKAQTERTGMTEAGATARAGALQDAENWRHLTPQASDQKYGAMGLKQYNELGQVTGETPFLYNQQTGEQPEWQKPQAAGAMNADWLKGYNAKNPAHIQELYGHYSRMSPDQQSQFGQALRAYPDLAIGLHTYHQQQQAAKPAGGLQTVGQPEPAPSYNTITNPVPAPSTGPPPEKGLNALGHPTGPVFFQPETTEAIRGGLNRLDEWGGNAGLIPSSSTNTATASPTHTGAPSITRTLPPVGRMRFGNLPGSGNPNPSNIMGKLQSLEMPQQ